MKQLVKSKVFMWAWLLAGLFALLVAIMPRAQLLAILNGVFLGVVAAVIIVYSPLIWVTARKKQFDRVGQLSLGIGLVWLSIAGQRLYWIIWNSNGSPISWQSNPFLAAMAFMAIIGGSLFVTAPGYPADTSLEPVEFWGSNRKLLLFFGFIGGTITFVLSMITSDMF